MAIYGFINEGYIKTGKDIYYNKNKFDSGEINLCFITGHSGSGKSTMASNMSKETNVEHYELDDLLKNYVFSDNNLKEYGDLIYSFFKNNGKKYRYTSLEDMKNCTNPLDDSGDKYDEFIIKDFINYAKKYSKSHKNTKFVLEGIWIYLFINPEELKDYAVYIKGTSRLISDIRAAKRDSKEDFPDKGKEQKRAFIGRAKNFFTKEALTSEKSIKKYRNYFSKLDKTSQEEKNNE